MPHLSSCPSNTRNEGDWVHSARFLTIDDEPITGARGLPAMKLCGEFFLLLRVVKATVHGCVRR